MAGPAGDRSTNGDHSNGAGSAEWNELRRLLIGSELDQLGDIEQRLDDPERRAADIAQVLPEAVKGARSRPLRESLEPIFEKSFQSSVRKHPRELSDAISPIIFPAVRKSIVDAIREFADSLNQIVEQSASLRALRWRIEAKVTGKPFTEILLARSLLYSVEQVFLIHRKSGILLQHVQSKTAVVKDADMISGMLTAIQDFFNDSFTDGGQELKNVESGQYRLWIQHGPKAIVVAAVSGSAPVAFKEVLRRAVERIHEKLYAELDTFKQDDLTPFEAARPDLEACLLGTAGPSRRNRWLPVAIAAVVLLAAVGLIVYRVRESSKWDRYFATLRSQPGLVVTGVSRHGSTYVVTGLKDPKAPDPALSAEARDIDARQVRFEWQPYLSLNTPFAAEREREAAKNCIEKQIIRFETGTSRLQLAESDRIETLAAATLRLPAGTRVILTGHTDEVGSTDTNMKLSQDRAARVREAMVAQGAPQDRLEAVGVGNTAPVRGGSSDWDRAANRSVSFRVISK